MAHTVLAQDGLVPRQGVGPLEHDAGAIARLELEVGLVGVGLYPGSASPTGFFDLGGNVAEWTETVAGVDQFFVVGGDFSSPVSVLNRLDAGMDFGDVSEESEGLGFRVVPEPSTSLMLIVGAGLLGAIGRRRQPGPRDRQ